MGRPTLPPSIYGRLQDENELMSPYLISRASTRAGEGGHAQETGLTRI